MSNGWGISSKLKNNLGKYLLLSVTEDILITKNGKAVAKLVNPHQNRVDTAKSLFGVLPKDADIEEKNQQPNPVVQRMAANPHKYWVCRNCQKKLALNA